MSYLAEGGALAVQMADNLHEPSHSLMRMIAADGPWTAGWRRSPRRAPSSAPTSTITAG